MRLKNLLLFLLLPASVFMLHAQAPPPAEAPTPPAAPANAPPTPGGTARAPHAPPAIVAGIPVNYDQEKVGTYTLPDPLRLDNGKPVRNAKTWWTKRRPEIVRIFETQQYGIAPGRPEDESFKVVEKGSAIGGKALREQVVISFSKDPAWPKIHLLIYLPAAAKKPVPMYFTISFAPNQCVTDDPAIIAGEIWSPRTQTKVMPPQRYCFLGHLPVERLLDAGFGIASFYYGDVDPDYVAGFRDGIRAHYLPAGQTERAPDAWGSIAAWAWGMSRVEDYFETDPQIDAKRVAIQGVSRLGKTVMWAGAHDRRFAAVIASCSGEGGAALSHRDFGETIAHLTAPTRYPYQFAENYAKWGGFPDKAPMDANMLIALVAPRPLLLQTGSTDYWSDPKGEFLAEAAAAPVYKLLGAVPLETDVWPPAKTPILHDEAYYMHDGGHGMVPSDWDIYLEFLKMHLQPGQ